MKSILTSNKISLLLIGTHDKVIIGNWFPSGGRIFPGKHAVLYTSLITNEKMPTAGHIIGLKGFRPVEERE